MPEEKRWGDGTVQGHGDRGDTLPSGSGDRSCVCREERREERRGYRRELAAGGQALVGRMCCDKRPLSSEAASVSRDRTRRPGQRRPGLPSPGPHQARPPLRSAGASAWRVPRSLLRSPLTLPAVTMGTPLFQGEYEAALTIYDDHVSPCLHTVRFIAAIWLLVSRPLSPSRLPRPETTKRWSGTQSV